jgi:hypothetical protein
MGVVCGFICVGLMTSGGNKPHMAIILSAIFSRALIGFAIGISKLNKMSWWLHGIVMGFVFSIPIAFSSYMAPTPNPLMLLISTLLISVVYGLLIEAVTTKIFRAGINKAV